MLLRSWCVYSGTLPRVITPTPLFLTSTNRETHGTFDVINVLTLPPRDGANRMRFLLIIAIPVVVAWCSEAHANDVEPRLYSNVPTGLNFFPLDTLTPAVKLRLTPACRLPM